ncbi:MAG: DUF4157 domain-containing protein [Chitinophagaceae bacterium]
MKPVYEMNAPSKCSCGGKCGRCQRQNQQKREQEKTRLDSSAIKTDAGLQDAVQEVVDSPGQSLNRDTLQHMGSHFDHDFSKVRVHTNAKAADSANAINASAYTVGNNIVFDEGKFAPEAETGKQLLTHELTHVIQQADAFPDKTGLQIGKAGDLYEQEADSAASSVLSGKKPPTVSRLSSATIQRSIGSTLLDIALFVPRLFGLEVFTAEQLQDYLKELRDKKGPVNSLFSDNKARACVSREKELGPFDTNTKTWLIQDMLEGSTSFLDEGAIIDLLRRSSDREAIVKAVGRDWLWSNFGGENRLIIEGITLTRADAGEALVEKLRKLSTEEIKQFSSNALDADVKEAARKAMALSKITAPVPASAKVDAAGQARMDFNGIHVTFLPDSIDASLGKFGMTYGHFQFDMPAPIVITEANANMSMGEIDPVEIRVEIYTKYPSEEAKHNPSKYGVGTRQEDEKTLQYHERAHGKAWIEFLTKNPPPVFKGTSGMTPAQYNAAIEQWKTDTTAYHDKGNLFALKAGDCVGTLPTDEDYQGTGFTAAICHQD